MLKRLRYAFPIMTLSLLLGCGGPESDEKFNARWDKELENMASDMKAGKSRRDLRPAFQKAANEAPRVFPYLESKFSSETSEDVKSAALLIISTVPQMLHRGDIKEPSQEAHDFILSQQGYVPAVMEYISDLDRLPTFRDYPDALIKKDLP